MPRIYKPVGPSSNKAEAGPTANKGAALNVGVKAPKEPKKEDTVGDK